MSAAGASVGRMDQLTVSIEVCPVCSGVDVAAAEPAWFALDLDRAAELRDEVEVEFRCRECGSTWR